MTPSERAFMSHLLVCATCADGPHFCDVGKQLGQAFEEENRHLEVISDGMCWEPPLIDWPSEEEMDRAAAEYEAYYKDKL